MSCLWKIILKSHYFNIDSILSHMYSYHTDKQTEFQFIGEILGVQGKCSKTCSLGIWTKIFLFPWQPTQYFGPSGKYTFCTVKWKWYRVFQCNLIWWWTYEDAMLWSIDLFKISFYLFPWQLNVFLILHKTYGLTSYNVDWRRYWYSYGSLYVWLQYV